MAKQNKLGCDHPRIDRKPRQGFRDAFMFRLGKYPWTCRLCGCRLYLKDRRAGEHGTIRLESRQGTTAARS